MPRNKSLLKTSCTALVPCYNEATRVKKVLSTLNKCRYLDQIICVDDGSTDNTQEVIQKKFPKIKIISLKKNQGKSEAIKAGLKFIKTKYTILCGPQSALQI